MTDCIYNILNNNTFAISAISGILVSVSPCTIAANLSILSFLSQKTTSMTANWFLYILGKFVLYSALAILLLFFADSLDVAKRVQSFFGYIIGPLFIIIGTVMAEIIHIHGFSEKCIRRFKLENKVAQKRYSFFIGFILALAFCPYCASLFFGVLMPITISTSNAIHPILFALGASLPLLIIWRLFKYGYNRFQIITNKFIKLESALQKIVGIIFIIAGILFIYEYYIE